MTVLDGFALGFLAALNLRFLRFYESCLPALPLLCIPLTESLWTQWGLRYVAAVLFMRNWMVDHQRFLAKMNEDFAELQEIMRRILGGK